MINFSKDFVNWEWYSDTKVKIVFIHLLLNACEKDTKYQGQVIPSGSVLTTVNQLAKEVGLTVQETRTTLKKLSSTHEINTIATNKKTLVTLVNYRVYSTSTSAEQQDNNKRITNEQQTNNKPTTNQQQDNTIATNEQQALTPPTQTICNTSENAEQQTNNKQAEQEKKKEKERSKEKEIKKELYINNNIHLSAGTDEGEKINFAEIVDEYNTKTKSLPKVKFTSDKRKKALKSLLSKITKDELTKVFVMAEESDFLSGRSGGWNGCGFDWLINYNNAIKVLEGKYKNKGVDENVSGYNSENDSKPRFEHNKGRTF